MSRPMLFHPSFDSAIQVFNNNTSIKVTACPTTIYSNEPLKPYQKFTVKLKKISEKTKDLMSVGFTSTPPMENLQLTHCVKIISLRKPSLLENKKLYFYYTPEGTIHFGVDGTDKGRRDGKISTHRPLWAFIQITNPELEVDLVNCQPFDFSVLDLKPMALHQSRGRNIKMIDNVISKINREIEVGYAFTLRPLQVGENVIVNILHSPLEGCLILGLTDCDPSSLDQKHLPDDIRLFLKGPGQWIVISDPSWHFQINDKISFVLNPQGKLRIFRNESTLLQEIAVDVSTDLWAILDISQLESIEVFSCLSNEFEENDSSTDISEVRNDAVIARQEDSEEEMCVVCCDHEVEAALHPCGHMCMCYKCAREQWRGTGQECCPMCRVRIKDVVKIYRI